MEKKYLLTVKTDTENLVFEFKTEEDRQGMIDELKEKSVEYATAETND